MRISNLSKIIPYLIIAVLINIFGLYACSPSQSYMETAIASTLAANPTSTIIPTATAIPTKTPLPTATATDIPKFNPDRDELGISTTTLMERLHEYGFVFRVAPTPVIGIDPPMEDEIRYEAKEKDNGEIYLITINEKVIFAEYSISIYDVRYSKLSAFGFSKIILGEEVFEKTIDSEPGGVYCIDGIVVQFGIWDDDVFVAFWTKEGTLYEYLLRECE